MKFWTSPLLIGIPSALSLCLSPSRDRRQFSTSRCSCVRCFDLPRVHSIPFRLTEWEFDVSECACFGPRSGPPESSPALSFEGLVSLDDLGRGNCRSSHGRSGLSSIPLRLWNLLSITSLEGLHWLVQDFEILEQLLARVYVSRARIDCSSRQPEIHVESDLTDRPTLSRFIHCSSSPVDETSTASIRSRLTSL